MQTTDETLQDETSLFTGVNSTQKVKIWVRYFLQ